MVPQLPARGSEVGAATCAAAAEERHDAVPCGLIHDAGLLQAHRHLIHVLLHEAVDGQLPVAVPEAGRSASVEEGLQHGQVAQVRRRVQRRARRPRQQGVHGAGSCPGQGANRACGARQGGSVQRQRPCSILSISPSTAPQQEVHNLRVAAQRRDVQRGAPLVVAARQVGALLRGVANRLGGARGRGPVDHRLARPVVDVRLVLVEEGYERGHVVHGRGRRQALAAAVGGGAGATR
mmetsp:Transcript_133315/g.414545  ORF Transcript_133315/g.414545 Transcript_133315/m.414545 type:complete len:236 (-) Transcript_133315:38-745(-)